MKDGIGYFDIEYSPDGFGQADDDTIELPVIFDGWGWVNRWAAIPFFYSPIEGTSTYDTLITNVKITTQTRSTEIYIPKGANNCSHISAHFTMPVSWYDESL